MWLYVPCLSVLGSEALTSDSMNGVELWATSSGKPSLRPVSWRGWKTRLWILRLSGTISRRSMAERGVEAWISSLRDTPASRSLSQGSEQERTTLATSGPTSLGSSLRLSLLWSSLRTSRGTSRSVSRKSSLKFPRWGSMRSGVASEQVKWEPPTVGRDSSSWPTATALSYGTNKGGSAGRVGPNRPSLETLVKGWATPTSRDWKSDDPAQSPNHSPPLGRQVLQTELAGKRGSSGAVLNPCFVEALMGFPPSWTAVTDSEPSATPSSPPKPAQPSENSPGGSCGHS